MVYIQFSRKIARAREGFFGEAPEDGREGKGENWDRWGGGRELDMVFLLIWWLGIGGGEQKREEWHGIWLPFFKEKKIRAAGKVSKNQFICS